jgi:Na+-driven multidrug efflux pump
LLLLIPFLLILPRYYGINGIWYSMPASDFLSVILGVSLLIPQVRKLKKMA